MAILTSRRATPRAIVTGPLSACTMRRAHGRGRRWQDVAGTRKRVNIRQLDIRTFASTRVHRAASAVSSTQIILNKKACSGSNFEPLSNKEGFCTRRIFPARLTLQSGTRSFSVLKQIPFFSMRDRERERKRSVADSFSCFRAMSASPRTRETWR